MQSHTQLHKPLWQQPLTVRGFLVAAVLGILFCIITIKLNLGSAGMTPSLNIAGGLLAYVLLKTFTQLGSACSGNSRPSEASLLASQLTNFTPQENAVVQTMTSACYSLAGYSGFGSYLLAMGYQAYLNLGGVPKGQPGFQEGAVLDPSLQRVYPYLLLIAFAGVFALLGLRNLLIITWRLPYPSGTASGVMINSLHMQEGEAAAASRKVKLLGFTASGSLLFDAFKWLFQGPDYRCGFAVLPTFGVQALQWTWHFDFQQQYIGAGMLVPHVVAWSMMLGAVLSWGVLWPLLAKREGDWYPAGLSGADMKGMAAYKIWLSVALLLGEGCYIMVKAVLLGLKHVKSHSSRHRGLGEWALQPQNPCLPTPAAAMPHPPSTDALLPASTNDSNASSDAPLRAKDASIAISGLDSVDTFTRPQGSSDIAPPSGCSGGSSSTVIKDGGQQQNCCLRQRGGSSSRSSGHDGNLSSSMDMGTEDHHSEGAVAGIAFKETREERSAREAVFLSCVIPWWVGPCGYLALAVLSIICMPLLYPPAKWYMVLVAYILGPPIALANSYGAGLTDQDNGANYATLALFLFAAWGGSTGNGIIAGCALMGVVMVCAVTASVLMQDFRTAYVTQTPPTAMFVAQVTGTAMGVLFAPLVFFMFWKTGLVGRKDGPYPNPFADVSRGIAMIGTEGLAALPKHCGTLAAAFFAAGLLICFLRDLLPARLGRFVPSPMGMAFSFYIGANNAIDFFVGSLIMLVWEWKRPQAALQLGPLVGAGLIVGDGLWSIPAALLAIGNVAPPMCMKYS